MKLIKFLMIIPLGLFAAQTNWELTKVNTEPRDLASLQRGAKTFANHCQGCHSLKLIRYQDLAKGIGIVDVDKEVLTNIVLTNLHFDKGSITDPLYSNINSEDAAKWFGKNPPDLSLVARSRGPDWLYTYMQTFYRDPTRPFGVNNLVYPNVGMPHVLEDLQGIMDPVYDKDHKIIKLVKNPNSSVASLDETGYNRLVYDLVNFLDYVGEPHKQARKDLGALVVLGTLALTVLFYLVKREYWKDIKDKD